jgi:tetratricopeptide (TPR) repeat protein
MNLLAQSALFLWIPMVVVIFACLPPKRAVVTGYVFAWLYLPNVGYGLPGLPDYTKMTATVLGVLLCMMLFDASRLFTFRFRWYDMPMLVWCVGPFITALTNDLGPYEGLSASVTEVFIWGLPYLIGRLYLTDLDSMRELAMAIVVGGLTYIPLCLIEIRLSPRLESWVYGINRWEGTRYGGYRPKAFLATGLELGLWMTIASLTACQLWFCGAVKRLRGISFGWLLIGLLVTTVLCKSTGAIVLLVAGIGALGMVRLTKRSWPIWALMLIPLFYVSTRATNVWSGQQILDITLLTAGADRAESYEYRLDMENKVAAKARERPIMGWGRFSRSNLTTKEGAKSTVQDGWWLVVLGVNGRVGLATMVTLMLLPMVLTIRRFPVRTWFDPQVGPVVALSLVLVLIMCDFLSNAMLNPIYAVTIGGLLGQSAVRITSGLKESESRLGHASDLMSEGRIQEAAEEFHQTVLLVADGEDIQGRQIHASALDGLGHSLLAMGRLEEAENAFKDGLMVRDWLAANAPDAGRFRDLAIAREGLSRLLAETGRPLEAVEERQIALRIWDILVREHSRNTDYRNYRIVSLNDLAWLLATDPDPRVQDPSQALILAEEAVRSARDHEASWNTLGVARYRVGDLAGAIESLERSALSSLDGLGTAFDHYFLSMAWCRLQHEGQAREWLERGIAWTARNRPGHPTLERFREEAEQLLMSESDQPGLETS